VLGKSLRDRETHSWWHRLPWFPASQVPVPVVLSVFKVLLAGNFYQFLVFRAKNGQEVGILLIGGRKELGRKTRFVQ